MRRSTQIFWDSRFRLVLKTSAIWGDITDAVAVDRESVDIILTSELAEACQEDMFGHLNKNGAPRSSVTERSCPPCPHDAHGEKLGQLLARLESLQAEFTTLRASLDRSAGSHR